MTNRELQDRLKLMADDFVIQLVTPEVEGFNVEQVISFPQEKVIWITLDTSYLENDDDEEIEDDDPGSDGPRYEREGDMCTLPEVSGEKRKCTNPFCHDGMTDAGPCLICEIKEDKKTCRSQPPLIDACLVKGRVKISGA